MKILEVKGVSKYYSDGRRKIKALDNISFSIDEPQVLAVLGPNGAGKTTLLRIISALLDCSEGKVFLFGKSPHDFSLRRRVSFLCEDFVIPEFLKVKEVFKIVSGLKGTGGLDKGFYLFEDWQGIENKSIGELSAGTKRMLQIAISLWGGPEILVWDEPTVFLDIPTKLKFANLLKILKDQGRTLIISSHILSEIEKLCHRAIFLNEGKILKILESQEIEEFPSLEEAFIRFYELN